MPGTATTNQLPVVFNNPNLPKLPPSPFDSLKDQIPFLVVGYEGWQKRDSLKGKFDSSGGLIDAVLQLDKGFFASSSALLGVPAEADAGLNALLCCIQRAFSYVQNAQFDLTLYMRNPATS